MCSPPIESEELRPKLYVDDVTLQNLFDKCDVDGNGYITRDELKRFLEHLRNNDRISGDKVDRLYERADRNGNNRIERAEFERMLEDPLFKRSVKQYLDIFVPETCRQTRYKYREFGVYLVTTLQVVLHVARNCTRDDVVFDALAVDPQKDEQVWRYVTYMFVHDGWSHLVVNLVFQLSVGVPLEYYHGWWRMAVVYFGGGLAGSLATALIQPNVHLVGASGGVYAILGAQLATIVMNFSEITMPVVQLVCYAVWVGLSCGQPKSVNNRISYVAHGFGVLAGFLAGVVVLRNFKIRRFEMIIRYAAILLLAALMIALLITKAFIS